MIHNIHFRAAFEYAKAFQNGGEEAKVKNKEKDDKESGEGATKVKTKVEKTLHYDEFQIFFLGLRQYLTICQVGIKENINVVLSTVIRGSKRAFRFL